MGIGQFIYDFQTLFAGAGALIAARIAVKPVWTQIGLLQTQSNGVLREMLSQRQGEIEQSRAAMAHKVEEPLNALGSIFYQYEFEGAISEEEAFFHDQRLTDASAWYSYEYRWRDNEDVETARLALLSKLDLLLDALRDIHRPAHTEQHDEDHSIPDQEWEEFVARGDRAKGEVEVISRSVKDALNTVMNGMMLETLAVKSRLKKLDKSIISG